MKAKTLSAIDEFKRLRDVALREQMDILKQVQENLKLFGIAVSWIGESKPKPQTKGAGSNPDKVCKICGEPGHDGRKHRWEKQRVKKAAKKSAAK